MKKILYIFGQLNDRDVEWLINNGEKESVAPGEILIQKGVSPKHLYIVLDGSFVVLAGQQEDRKVTSLPSGEVIGEMSFLDSTPPFTSVKAEIRSAVFCILKSKIEEKIKEDQGFGCRFYKAISIFLADRLRGTTNLYGDGSSKEKERRDELEVQIFDRVSVAGERFHRMLCRMQQK